jgi:hypothetical protein
VLKTSSGRVAAPVATVIPLVVELGGDAGVAVPGSAGPEPGALPTPTPVADEALELDAVI